VSDDLPDQRPPAQAAEEAAPAPEHLQLQRTMRVGPTAGAAAVGLLAIVAAAALLPGLGGGVTATPARTPSASATPTPPSAAVAAVPTGPLTLAPLPGTSPTQTATPTTASPTRSASKATASARPSSAAPATTTPASAYPDVRGFRECDRSGTGPFAAVATGNSSTSCGFAVNVWQAYRDRGLNGGSGTVTAASPATGKTYEVTCSGSQPAVCTGGTAGRVLIYGGRLVAG